MAKKATDVIAPTAVMAWSTILAQMVREQPYIKTIELKFKYYEISCDRYYEDFDLYNHWIKIPITKPPLAITDEMQFAIVKELSDNIHWLNINENRCAAISTEVTCSTVFGDDRKYDLDIIDVEPGHIIEDNSAIFKNYHVLKTKNSYHIYAKQNVTGRNGGHCIKDMDWSLGFIRVTENVKGPITRVHEKSTFTDSGNVP